MLFLYLIVIFVLYVSSMCYYVIAVRTLCIVGLATVCLSICAAGRGELKLAWTFSLAVVSDVPVLTSEGQTSSLADVKNLRRILHVLCKHTLTWFIVNADDIGDKLALTMFMPSVKTSTCKGIGRQTVHNMSALGLPDCLMLWSVIYRTHHGYLYITIIYNISITLALCALFLFTLPPRNFSVLMTQRSSSRPSSPSFSSHSGKVGCYRFFHCKQLHM